MIPLPGGFQPRAAVGYGLVGGARGRGAVRAGAVGCTPRSTSRPRTPTRSRGSGAPARPRTRSPSAWPASLHGAIPIITGAGLTAPIAYRWKTQFNENAKSPAFAGELPEIDHNEMVGWKRARGSVASPPCSSTTATCTPRPDADRADPQLIADGTAASDSWRASGQTRVERLVSLVLLGDLVTLYRAILDGVDPAEIDVLVELKAAS